MRIKLLLLVLYLFIFVVSICALGATTGVHATTTVHCQIKANK